MKKTLVALWLLAGWQSNAQSSTGETASDTASIRVVQLPDSTAIGNPIGEKVIHEIGPAGGTIVSYDGKVKLIFPKDALTKTTAISIQPVTTLIPNGNRSYQFEPSGIQFQKPVEVIYQYTDEEAEACPPEFKFMALQDHKGKWEYANYEEWDSATKSLKTSISHFSVFGDGNMAALSDTVITVKVDKTHRFNLIVVQPPPAPAAPGEDELPSLPVTARRNNREALWKVNGIPGGNGKFGKISTQQVESITAEYRAPVKLTADPITVKLELNNTFIEQVTTRTARRGRMTTNVTHRSNLASFSCKVNLYDEYKVIVGMGFKLDGAEMTDTSMFKLRIGTADRVSISDIHNEMAKLHIRQNRCRAIYVNESTCIGMINVTGIKTSNLMPGTNSSVKIDVFFKPAPLIFPVINFPPCGINRASVTTPPMVAQSAFPMWLHFEAKNEKQLISLGKGNGAVVSRADPEDIIAVIEPIRE